MNDGAALFLGYPKTNIVTGSYLKGAVMYPSDYYWITNKLQNSKGAIMAENILTVENLNIAYQGVPAVMDVNFTLERGKVLTIVGESGSGKTTVIRALMGLLPVGGEVTEGSMIFNGHDLRNLSKSEWRSLRGKDMAMIFQDSGSAWIQSYVSVISSENYLSLILKSLMKNVIVGY